MSRKERDRIPVMRAISEGKLNQVEAAQVLGVSPRQVQRIWRRYQDHGDAGLVHRSRGKPGPRRKPQAFRDRVLTLVRERYPDFGCGVFGARTRTKRGSRDPAALVSQRGTAAAQAEASNASSLAGA